MRTPTKINRVAGLSLLVLLAVGCDFSKQLTAKTLTVATVLTTPVVDLPVGALAGNGLDAGFSFDGSFPFDGGFDAGVLLGDAGLRVPGQNLVAVFFGQRQGDNLDVAPVGLAQAVVTLDEVGGGSWSLRDEGGGQYALVDAGFVYRDHATYEFTMRLSGTTYIAEVTDVPPYERVARFHEPPGYLTLAAGEALSFNRVEPASGFERPLGFITVFPLSAQGTQGQPTYTNLPKTPLEFLKLVVAPSDWMKTTVTIPGAAFPERDHNYLIVLQSAKRGGPKSDNLFAGSAVLAGTAEIGIVKTRP